VELVGGLVAGLDRRTPRHPERSHCLDRPVSRLGRDTVALGEDGSCGSLSVEQVRLAATATHLSIGAADLDDLDAFRSKQPCQPGTVGTAALNANAIQLPEVAQPIQDRSASLPSRRERRGADLSSEVIKCDDHVRVLVGVDAADHLPRCFHGGPFFGDVRR